MIFKDKSSLLKVAQLVAVSSFYDNWLGLLSNRVWRQEHFQQKTVRKFQQKPQYMIIKCIHRKNSLGLIFSSSMTYKNHVEVEFHTVFHKTGFSIFPSKTFEHNYSNDIETEEIHLLIRYLSIFGIHSIQIGALH